MRLPVFWLIFMGFRDGAETATAGGFDDKSVSGSDLGVVDALDGIDMAPGAADVLDAGDAGGAAI